MSENPLYKKAYFQCARRAILENEVLMKKFNAEKRIGYQIYKKALANGLILRPLGNVLYFNPALIITEEQLDTAIDIAYNALISILGE